MMLHLSFLACSLGFNGSVVVLLSEHCMSMETFIYLFILDLLSILITSLLVPKQILQELFFKYFFFGNTVIL